MCPGATKPVHHNEDPVQSKKKAKRSEGEVSFNAASNIYYC